MDKSLYGSDWQIIRNAIFLRDGFTCQQCGAMDYRYFTSLWRKNNDIPKPQIPLVFVQCAHLDNNKENMNESNLLTLCPKCHLKRDKEWKMFVRLSRRGK